MNPENRRLRRSLPSWNHLKSCCSEKVKLLWGAELQARLGSPHSKRVRAHARARAAPNTYKLELSPAAATEAPVLTQDQRCAEGPER